VSLTGGYGSVIGVLAGVLSYATLQETLAVIGAEDWQILLTTGGLLVIVAVLTAPHLKRELTGLRTRLRSRVASAGAGRPMGGPYNRP
jgi:ribose/xylose/arabinose/galactoside ABC-type transport system permease subunit